MTQKEIFNSENENLEYIYLHKEGIFWKAYERSAFRVIQRQPGFKLKKKFIKAVI